MRFKKEELILAEKLVIYNNFAQINGCNGRLLAELQIYPTPRIIWDFEVMGDRLHQFPMLNENLQQSCFLGYSLKIETLNMTRSFSGQERNSASGSAFKAYWGDPAALAHTFHFCLTNTKFQEKCLAQYRLQQSIKERRFTNDEYDNSIRRQGEVGKFIEVPLNSIWSIRLEIGKDALKWLNGQERNIGVCLTGMGELFQPKRAEAADDFPTSLTSITKAQDMLENLCQLLSYANGGFVAPVFIEAERYNLEGQGSPIVTVSSAIRTDYPVTSLEQLGESWLGLTSDLSAFVSCFNNFEKMLAQPFWKDTFYFVLIQYFQAIRFVDWEIAASATGSALERLSHAILVEDETDPTKKADFENLFSSERKLRDPANQKLGGGAKVTETRLRLLLERIGLTTDDIQEVKSFLDVRNDAVHPKVGGMTLEQRWRLILQGIQWIDEVLLWRLGYNGKYLNRIISSSSPQTSYGAEISPRYDLSLRDPSW